MPSKTTSSAIISDLCTILKGEVNYPFGVSTSSRKKVPKFNILNHSCSSYLSIEVKDLPKICAPRSSPLSLKDPIPTIRPTKQI